MKTCQKHVFLVEYLAKFTSYSQNTLYNRVIIGSIYYILRKTVKEEGSNNLG